PYDYYRYTEFALRRFVERVGLRLLRLDPIGGAPEIVADIFAKNVLRVPWIGRSLAALSRSLTRFVIRTKLGKKVSQPTRDGFPFGYFLVAQKPGGWPRADARV